VDNNDDSGRRGLSKKSQIHRPSPNAWKCRNGYSNSSEMLEQQVLCHTQLQSPLLSGHQQQHMHSPLSPTSRTLLFSHTLHSLSLYAYNSQTLYAVRVSVREIGAREGTERKRGAVMELKCRINHSHCVVLVVYCLNMVFCYEAPTWRPNHTSPEVHRTRTLAGSAHDAVSDAAFWAGHGLLSRRGKDTLWC